MTIFLSCINTDDAQVYVNCFALMEHTQRDTSSINSLRLVARTVLFWQILFFNLFWKLACEKSVDEDIGIICVHVREARQTGWVRVQLALG